MTSRKTIGRPLEGRDGQLRDEPLFSSPNPPIGSDEVREGIARKLHEVIVGSDPDELIHHPAAKSWEAPTEPRWMQWLEAADAILASPEVERLRVENAALTKALTGLTCGGSEFFVRSGDGFSADIDACVAWVRRTKEDAHRRTMQALKRAHAAEARARTAEEALAKARDLAEAELAKATSAETAAQKQGSYVGEAIAINRIKFAREILSTLPEVKA